MIFYRECIPCKRQDIALIDTEPLPVGFRDIDLPGDLLRTTLAVDQLHPLLAEVLPDDRPVALPERRFEDIELVGVDGTLDDHLAETVGSGDEDDVPEACIGIEREYDPACGEI